MFYSFWDLISLTKQLGSWKLSNNSPQYLIAKSRQNLLLIIFAKSCIDGIQSANLRMEEDSNWKFNALHISISSFCEYFILSCLNIIDDGGLEERNLQVEAFSVDGGI